MATAAMNPSSFVDFTLNEIQVLTPNTSRFVFNLPADQVLGMTTTSCLMIKFTNAEGKAVIRPYTPTSDATQKGQFDLIVKRYDAGVMSAHIHNLKIGDTLALKGPMSKYPLQANQHESVSLIAGGTGITPMWQVISALLKDSEDKTKINLLFANQTAQDIILKSEIEALAAAHPDRFKVTYVIDAAAEGWTGETGYITADLIKKYLPEAGSAGNKVFVCGPPPMMVSVCGPKGPNFTQGEVEGALKELGLTIEQVFKF
ncbi:NADH-cytochrome b5 reductase [Podila verticillata]|nr:NADH-cytochrome b5 reductase [Haplosporangium bisporale]KAF9215943.1 NADH-cytochrome b5 reductase [Podila verticillata]KAF9380673.1 NADH-cytochrome b5 reductase [Podila verticillata]KFH73743.1 cytochrome-b5 reductase [Podila verticillata NRRL 6337]